VRRVLSLSPIAERDGGDGMTAPDLSCPLPLADYPRVLLAHGGGGRLTRSLVRDLFAAAFDNPLLAQAHDGAAFDSPGARLAFTTDSYVVRPLFFPGGDIGELAVYGTVNDLAMCGARPLYLSAGFILEEGLEIATLWRIAQSMARAARRAGVALVTGDTKVVERGKGDGVFISTAGVGAIEARRLIAPSAVRPGDAILVSGDVGRHGIAILAARADLALQSPVESDCAPLSAAVRALLATEADVHCLRDLTRGGLASALNEIATARGVRIAIEEAAIPVREVVRGACELLGLDPLYVANEGRFAAFVPERDAARAADLMGASAVRIGQVAAGAPLVVMKSRIGGSRVVDMLSGEQLPRIC
jgi:hydrogenase expression/formation protein HypE